MRIRDPITEAEEPFNLVPLTDMVFNLLIFFMAATTFAQVEKDLKVQLPHATAFATLSAQTPQLTINIDEDGTPIVRRQRYNLNELNQLVQDALRRNADASVLIRVDERGRVKGFTDVADLCKRAGVKQANIGYLSGGGSSAATP